MPGGTDTIINNGFGSPSGMSGADVANSYWQNPDVFSDFFRNQDSFSHNEALATYEREKIAAKEAFEREADYNAKEAQKTRDFEEYMSNTAFQRKVADYVKAGFSPLAALEGSVGASTPSGVAASASSGKANAQAATRGQNPLGPLLGSLVAAFALVMTKGISAGVQMKAASAADAAKIADNEAKMIYGFEKQRMDLQNKKEFEVFKKALWSHR